MIVCEIMETNNRSTKTITDCKKPPFTYLLGPNNVENNHFSAKPSPSQIVNTVNLIGDSPARTCVRTSLNGRLNDLYDTYTVIYIYIVHVQDSYYFLYSIYLYNIKNILGACRTRTSDLCSFWHLEGCLSAVFDSPKVDFGHAILRFMRQSGGLSVVFGSPTTKTHELFIKSGELNIKL